MQKDLRAAFPDFDVQFIGVNAVGHEGGVPDATATSTLPLLQDRDLNTDGESDVWDLWGAEWRDVVILDEANHKTGTYNLLTHDLTKPEDYDALRQMVLANRTETPREISGFVYHDANGSSSRDVGEPSLANVLVTLDGTDRNGIALHLEQRTDAGGFYRFVGLPAGSYRIRETQPEYLADGGEHLGEQGGVIAKNDEFSVEIGARFLGSNYDFGERGRQATAIDFSDFLASTPRQATFAAARPDGDASWFATNGTWGAYRATRIHVQPDAAAIKITAADAGGQQRAASFSLHDPRHVHMIGQDGNSRLLRITGSPDKFPFQVVASASSSAATSEAEGESAAASPTPISMVQPPLGIVPSATGRATDWDPPPVGTDSIAGGDAPVAAVPRASDRVAPSASSLDVLFVAPEIAPPSSENLPDKPLVNELADAVWGSDFVAIADDRHAASPVEVGGSGDDRYDPTIDDLLTNSPLPELDEALA